MTASSRRSPSLGTHASLHVIVLLWGLTAILGRQISISAIPLVWYRLLGSIAVLALVVALRRTSFRIPWRTAVTYGAVGGLIGLHWVCFYAAIKMANIATAVLSLSTVTFFTAVFEPMLFKRRVDAGELMIGAIVVGAASLLIQYELRVEPLGLVLGLGSAVLAAVFGVLNARLAHREPAERLMFFELAGATIVVGLCFVGWPSQLVLPPAADLGWLAFLAIVCTVIPQVWIIHVLRVLPPFTIAVTLNLEPVYALILAAVLFPNDPAPSAQFYAGAAVLFALVIVNGVRKARALRGARPVA
ncbi:MAG TPA: DMT family transporter [Kofleriaceae bacterium]|nr:DMT family transporter [Kofleriaceae bacterium]